MAGNKKLKLADQSVEPGYRYPICRSFPVSHSIEEAEEILKWMIHTPGSDTGKALWLKSRRLSADSISARANLIRLFGQRKEFQIKNWTFLAENYEKVYSIN